MNNYSFRINDSGGKEYVLSIKANNHSEARGKAYDFCYRAGYCFIGRF